MKKLPVARTANIVVQTLGKEVLIYDLSEHRAFNLNETSGAVYQACDGKTSFDELRIKNNFTDELIFLALDELKKENLIEDDNSLVSPFSGMTRREALRKAGLASMIALPVITSLVAPTAAMSQSDAILGATATCDACTTDAQCISGNCVPAAGGGSVCSAGSGSDAFGTVIGFFNEFTCPTDGVTRCCSGSATYDPGLSVCTCS